MTKTTLQLVLIGILIFLTGMAAQSQQLKISPDASQISISYGTPAIEVATYNQGVWVTKDTAFTMACMVNILAEDNKQIQAAILKLDAANDVLKYIDKWGLVTNWTKFYNALKSYRALQ